jgi:ubiquinone/menaquinone biosynthesis C-methylase UbiE
MQLGRSRGQISLLHRLAGEGVLRCPRCRAGLEPNQGGLDCAACGQIFTETNGVLDLYGMTPPGKNRSPEQISLIPALRQALNLPESTAVEQQLANALDHARIETGHYALTAELQDLVDRFGLAPPGESGGSPEADGSFRLGSAAVAVERHYAPASLQAREVTSLNVRVRNRGKRPAGPGRTPSVGLGSVWTGASGEAPAPAAVTPLPVVLEPGRAVTVPVRVEAPQSPGRYTLTVGPVIAGRVWRCSGCAAIAVDVRPPGSVDSGGSPALPLVSGSLEYAEDHAEAVAMLVEAAMPRLDGRRGRLLEIGGGTHPQLMWQVDHDLVNLDISLPLLDLGSIWMAHHLGPDRDLRIGMVCADANELPFEDDSFDVVALFAALHHFPKPEVLLAECRRVLAAGGLVGVFCDPCGDSIAGPLYARELNKGINEQVFSQQEYLRLFAAAGLQPVTGNQRGESLKVVLEAADPSGERFDRPLRRPPLKFWRAGLKGTAQGR